MSSSLCRARARFKTTQTGCVDFLRLTWPRLTMTDCCRAATVQNKGHRLVSAERAATAVHLRRRATGGAQLRQRACLRSVANPLARLSFVHFRHFRLRTTAILCRCLCLNSCTPATLTARSMLTLILSSIASIKCTPINAEAAPSAELFFKDLSVTDEELGARHTQRCTRRSPFHSGTCSSRHPFDTVRGWSILQRYTARRTSGNRHCAGRPGRQRGSKRALGQSGWHG